MKNASSGKVTSGRTSRPSTGTSAPASGSKPMPRVGGHTSNNGNGRQGC